MRLNYWIFIAFFVSMKAASAGYIYDTFYANAYDLANSAPMIFSDAYITPSTLYLTGVEQARADVGNSSVSRAAASATSVTQYGRLRGYAASGEAGDAAHFESGWRDVLSVTGGVGTGILQVTGHADGFLSGGSSYFAFSTALANSGGSVLVGNSFSNRYDANTDNDIITNLGSCPAQICTISINGDFVRLDFDMSIRFEYGAPNLLVVTNSGFADTGSDGRPSLANFLSTFSIDSIIAPAGSILTSAAGPLAFSNGTWSYPVSTVNSVPEPSTFALMLICLASLLISSRRRRGARSYAQ